MIIKNRHNLISKLILLSVSFLFLIIPVQLEAQPDPNRAFLRSLVMPGWGHHYAEPEISFRGQAHFAADLILIASFFGFNARANNLEDQYTTLANLRAGVPTDGRSRTFLLALSQFNSLEEYNDFQLRSRNWNNILPDTPENRWNWQSEDDRRKYRELRDGSDRAGNQLPAITALLVLNRVTSAVSAFNRARNYDNVPDLTFTPVLDGRSQTGIMANLNFRF